MSALPRGVLEEWASSGDLSVYRCQYGVHYPIGKGYGEGAYGSALSGGDGYGDEAHDGLGGGSSSGVDLDETDDGSGFCTGFGGELDAPLDDLASVPDAIHAALARNELVPWRQRDRIC